MHTFKHLLATTALAGVFSVGTAAGPALAAANDEPGSSAAGVALSTSVDTTATNTADVQQDGELKIRPGDTYVYTGTNLSAIDQTASTLGVSVMASEADITGESTVTQEASNSAKVRQGNMIALPHSVLYYYGSNYSIIQQQATNTSVTWVKSNGTVKLKSKVKQHASNSADVQQGVVKALPNSTVYYEGHNLSYVEQGAGNWSATAVETPGSVETDQSLQQSTANTAEVQQGVVEFPRSTVHDNGENLSIVVQKEANIEK